MAYLSDSDLPRITKRELARVGIELRFEDSAREWMRRGWFELNAYRCRTGRFEEWERLRDRMENNARRIFEEDGA